MASHQNTPGSAPGLTSFYSSSAVASATPSSHTSQPEDSRKQSEMKDLIEDELKDATYHVDLTTKGNILQVDPRIVETAIQNLETTFQALTSGGHSSAADPRFPVNGFDNEPPSYEPLAHLLNKIVDAASRCVPPQSQLSGLRFHRFGREVNERYGSLKGLKPDGVGTIGELPTETEEPAEGPAKKFKLSWEQIEIIVESKASVKEIVKQSGTYARCSVLNNRRRFFSLGIGFHFRNLEAYVFAYNHAGLASSHPLNLSTPEGFNGLVRHIVGILSIKDEAAYGLDPTRFQNIFHINNRHYEIVRIIYARDSLRGRSTAVYSLKVTDVTPQRQLESRVLTLSKADHLPERLTYKQSYQIKGYSQEGPLFSQFYGQFGIADIIGYHECGPEDPHGSTRRLFEGAQFWTVFGQQDLPGGRRRDPEDRGLQCIALSGEGKALVDPHNTDGGTPSPGELLESILHAIIGHYNLFDKGILHRDISSGNVLRYSEPIKRPALDKFECTKNVDHCRGFLIDGDHAIKWREFSNSQSISGTMPFMSMRLLNAWEGRNTTIHTALDDLESFLWLLIWGIIYASKDIEGAKGANPGIHLMLVAWSGNLRSNRTKLTAAVSWDDAVFGDLIREWLNTFQEAAEENRQITRGMSTMRLGSQEWVSECNELESYCKDIYKKVLECGFRHLEEVKNYPTWDRVVAANLRKPVRKRKRETPDERGAEGEPVLADATASK